VAPEFFSALKVHFIETSPRLRAEQARRVGDALWHEDLTSLPACPSILLANEFLDALPIRQFVRRSNGWRERYVQGAAFVEMPAEDFARDAVEGSVVEVSDVARDWIMHVSRRILAHGGVALILDYGSSETRPGESLQALRGGKPADPLAEPGCADLTAHVDFAALARAAKSTRAAVWGPVSQGDFLERLGLWVRTAALEAANPARSGELRAAAHRLASPARMGDLFKAMCVTRPDFPAPPGFER
jgi:SAM-dependent MidA family methyltransferase